MASMRVVQAAQSVTSFRSAVRSLAVSLKAGVEKRVHMTGMPSSMNFESLRMSTSPSVKISNFLPLRRMSRPMFSRRRVRLVPPPMPVLPAMARRYISADMPSWRMQRSAVAGAQ